MAQIYRCQIMDVRHLNDKYCCLVLSAPEIAAEAQPGQFVNIQVGEANSNDPLLKRPFSIYRIDPVFGRIKLLIKIIGRGTTWLSNLSMGSELEVIGPLGHGFKLQKSGKALLIAGGIGVAPLKELAVELFNRGIQVSLLLGVTDEEDLVLFSEIADFKPQVIMVHPGKTGERQGLVTQLVSENLDTMDYDQIYTCGPEPMLKALQKQLGELNKIAQFSLEERMGCGVGLCYSCVSKVRKGEETTEWKYGRICTCGPVFLGDEVIFDD